MDDGDEKEDESSPVEAITPSSDGKRKRTAVVAFTSAVPVKETKPLELEAGKGCLLGEMEIGKWESYC